MGLSWHLQCYCYIQRYLKKLLCSCALHQLFIHQSVTSWNNFLGHERQVICYSDFQKLQSSFADFLECPNLLKDYSLLRKPVINTLFLSISYDEKFCMENGGGESEFRNDRCHVHLNYQTFSYTICLESLPCCFQQCNASLNLTQWLCYFFTMLVFHLLMGTGKPSEVQILP